MPVAPDVPRQHERNVIIPIVLSLLLFTLHMLFNGRYGYFVDELYYLACSHHLAWGYVDQAPLIALITFF
jgi:hypothetical protein